MPEAIHLHTFLLYGNNNPRYTQASVRLPATQSISNGFRCVCVCVYACVCVSNTFKNYGCCCCLVVKSNSFVMPWTVAYQVPLSMGFARQNTDVGCHFLLWEIFLTQGLKPRLLLWQAESLPLSHQGSPNVMVVTCMLLVPRVSWFSVTWICTKQKQGWIANFLQVTP